jgi:Ser/Thr protein kinase RdoA (MazF antagonist)
LRNRSNIETLEEYGFRPTGEYVQQNSYENRVFEILLESNSRMAPRLIVKVYRPGRWSREQILEEHRFIAELSDHGLTTAPPAPLIKNQTLGDTQGLLFAVFPKMQGRLLQEVNPEILQQLGRILAQIHNVGQTARAVVRKQIDAGFEPLEILQNWVAPEVWSRYEAAAVAILTELSSKLRPQNFIRIHGDFHRGNILHRGPGDWVIIDFDDFMVGPAIQDFWMLLSGENEAAELDSLRSGYEELREFPDDEVELIPLLRGLRIISYAAWIARRWDDPVFPQLFPQFTDYVYWAEEVEALEKIAWRPNPSSGRS